MKFEEPIQPSQKGREVILGSGEPEDIEQRRTREETARIKLVERAGKNLELAEAVEQFDFGTLRSIFEKIAEKSGFDPKLMNFIGPERIAHSSLTLGIAAYSAYENIIGISYQELKRSAEELGVNLEVAIIHTICHEETHATSKVECRGLEQWWGDPKAKLMSRRIGKVGYIRLIQERNKPDDFLFNLFGEGVTEKLSREVFREYIHRTGFRDKEAIASIKRARSLAK